jgi:hypothetical protein
MGTRLTKVMLALAAAALVGGLFTAREARAGMVVINTGEDVFETGDVPKPFDDYPELENAKAGYKCKIFGVFWAYFAKWDCEPVAFDEAKDMFWDDEDLVKALEKEYDEGDIKMPFWKGYGKFVVGVGFLGLVGVGILRRRKK